MSLVSTKPADDTLLRLAKKVASPTITPGFFARRRWLVWAAGIAAAVVLLASFMSRDDAVPLRAALAQRNTIRSVVSTNGKVEPIQSFEAHAPVSTVVRKLLVKEGDHVKKGQLLVQLDDAQARSQAARALSQVSAADADLSAIQTGGNREEVLTVEAQLVKAQGDRDSAQRNLDALQRLQSKGSASVGEVKEAENQLARANAELKLLQQKQKDRYSRPEIARAEAQKAEAQSAHAAAEDTLDQLNIRAPFDGVVYSLPLHHGAYVNPGDLVLQEADLSKVLVRAFVDEPDVGRLARGQAIEVTWDAVPGRIWTGAVSTIPTTVRLRGTRNVGETTCVVDNHDLKLLPNVNVGITIVTAEHRNALTVPREAVRQDDSKTYVYEIVNGELQRRDVQIAASNLTQVEVTGGISDNTEVALASVNSKPLHSGLAVKVVH
jgi:HlyD family secretion protein